MPYVEKSKYRAGDVLEMLVAVLPSLSKVLCFKLSGDFIVFMLPTKSNTLIFKVTTGGNLASGRTLLPVYCMSGQRARETVFTASFEMSPAVTFQPPVIYASQDLECKQHQRLAAAS